MTSPVQFDREKMRAVILRTCRSCAPADLGAVKLHKVLYFLDMVSYANRRTPVTGATYRKRPNGPTAEQLLFQLRDMAVAGDIEIRTVNYHGFLKKEYVALRDEPSGILSEDEIALLDDVIDFVCRQNTAKSISEYSHQIPWEMAEMGGEIPYHSAMLLFPLQPSPEAFDAVEKGMPEIEAARSQGNAMDLQNLGDFRGRLLAAFS